MVTSAQLIPSLSHERLSYWTVRAGGDTEKGLLLHRRNTLMGAFVFEDLQLLEIALRNRCDAELRKDFNANWPRVPPLRSFLPDEVAKHVDSRPHDKTIIQLTFGFWVRLLHEATLKDCLKRAFSGGLSAPTIQRLEMLRELRNDIVHHEPILNATGSRLQKSLKALYEILRSLDPVLAQWAAQHSWARRAVDKGFASHTINTKLHVQFYVP
jgi:hypothetical protein